MKKQEEPEITAFLTIDGVDVTKQLQEGRTTPFKDRTDAIEYAKTNNSYVYDLICVVSKKGSKQKRLPYGYAVPN